MQSILAPSPITVTLPQLAYPFPAQLSPHVQDLRETTSTWLAQWCLVPPTIADRWVAVSQVDYLAGRFHPTASHAGLTVIAQWYAWGLVRDDLCDETALGKTPDMMVTLNRRCSAVLRGGTATSCDHPLVQSLADLRQRLLLRANPTWFRRFRRNVEDYLDATVWEATNRVRGITPDLPTYLRMRILTSALHTDTDLIEVAEGTRLPSEVLAHPLVQCLTLASNNVVCWANDILSLNKEVTCGDPHDLVVVLQQTYNLSWQAAIDAAAAMHDQEVALFVESSQQLPHFSQPVAANLAAYVAVLRSRMRGGLDWAVDSGRYYA